MEVPFNTEFEVQTEKFSFCFTCDNCAHFDDADDTCLHGFPNRMHHLSYYRSTPRPATILFCKDFDLA